MRMFHSPVVLATRPQPAPRRRRGAIPTCVERYEVACHEGNTGLANILSGARAEERRSGTSR